MPHQLWALIIYIYIQYIYILPGFAEKSGYFKLRLLFSIGQFWSNNCQTWEFFGDFRPTFQAHQDLAESQKLDFDDDTAEVCHQKVSGNSQANSRLYLNRIELTSFEERAATGLLVFAVPVTEVCRCEVQEDCRAQEQRKDPISVC